MANGNVTNASSVYLKDKGGSIVLPATDWSVINNKPTNLVTTDQLPKDSGWKNGSFLNGTTGTFRYRIIGSTIHMYAQISNYPNGSNGSSSDNYAVQYQALPNAVTNDEISDWVSVDGNAKAQVGFKLKDGVLKVYRIEGTANVMRFYRVFAID